MDMTQGSGVTDEGRKAMREFMQSREAGRAMTNMMEMARSIGNRDVMLAMTRMLEMLSSMGSGMMGGSGSMGRADMMGGETVLALQGRQ